MADSDRPPGDLSSASERAEEIFLLSQEADEDLDTLLDRHPDLRADLLAVAEEWSWLEGHREGDRLPDDLLDALRTPEARYRRKGTVGSGGMGTVWRARDTHLDRDLAMKVSTSRQRRGTQDRQPARSRGVYRMLDEARVMGQLDHPGVLPVHDVGVDDDGHAWFTMDLVEGDDLNTLLKTARKSGTLPADFGLPRLIRILVQVAETVAFAHERGVLHRDLKPHNVMVGGFGQVYVMDWGLARVGPGDTGAQDGPVSVRISGTPDLLTVDGDVIGTPAYMAPEQARPGRQVGPRTDVYAMGALLYHVLAGRAPYSEGASSEGGGTGTILDAVRSGPPVPLASSAPGAPQELVAVAERAMARDPHKRYGTMLELRDDLLAWADGRPVSAAAPGLGTHVVKWAGRNRLAAAALLAAVFAAVAGTALTLRAERARSAQERTKNAELERERAATRAEADRAGAVAYAASLSVAQSAQERGSAREARRALDSVPTERRDWLWNLVEQEVDRSDLVLAPANGDPLGPLALDPTTGRLAVAAGSDVVLLNPAAPQEAVRFQASSGGVSDLAFHPWTGCLAIGGAQGEALIWRPGTQALAALESKVPDRSEVRLAFVPQGDSLWVCSWRAQGIEIHRGVGRGPGTLVSGPSQSTERLVLRPGRNEVLAQGFSGATVYDSESTSPLRRHEIPLDEVARLAPLGTHRSTFSADGSRLYMTNGEGDLLELDGDSAQRLRSWPVPRIPMHWLSMDPTGRSIALVGSAPSVALLRPAESQGTAWATGHTERITGAAWSSDGKALWTSSRDGTVRRFETDRIRVRRSPAIPSGSLKTGLVLDGENRRCFVTGREERVFVVDLDRGTATALPQTRPHRFSRIVDLELSGDGRSLRAISTSPRVHSLRWDLDGGTSPRKREIGIHSAFGAHFSPSGTIWAALVGPRVAGDLPGHPSPVVLESAVRPPWTSVEGGVPVCRTVTELDGALVASLDTGAVAIIDPSTDTLLAQHQLPCDSISAIALDGPGRTIAYGSVSGELLLVDPRTFRTTATLEPFRTQVVALQWLGGGKRLLAADRRGEIRIIDRSRGLTVFRAQSSSRRLYGAKADADAGLIVAVGSAGLDLLSGDPEQALRLPPYDPARVGELYAAPATRAEVLTQISAMGGTEPHGYLTAMALGAHFEQPLCHVYEEHAVDLESPDPVRARAMAEEALRMNSRSLRARDVVSRLDAAGQ